MGNEFLQLPDRVTRQEEALLKLTEEVRRISVQLEKLIVQVQELASVQKQMRDDLSGLKGSDRERYYRDNATAILGRYMTKVHVVDKGKLLDELHIASPLTDKQWDELVNLDLLVEGVTRETKRPLMLAMKISWVGLTRVSL